MIFDSEEIEVIRRKYEDISTYYAPDIVLLDRASHLAGEREYLEDLISQVPQAVQNKWKKTLLVDLNPQHIGTWFEMMLFGWLKKIGITDAEPIVEGNLPDFVLSTNDGIQVAIEARAWTIDEAERSYRKRSGEIFDTLDDVKRPFIIHVEKFIVGGRLNVLDFTQEVTNWLDTKPMTPLHYNDTKGNFIHLTAQYESRLTTVGVIGGGGGYWVNPAVLRSPLREKAAQHPKLRNAKHPYVIALFLESQLYSAEEVAEAWFGRQSIVIDTTTHKIVGERLDGSGLHFAAREIRHRSVSGTLIFRASLNKSTQMRDIDAWYIQNPYANAPINAEIFPVKSWFGVAAKTTSSYSMKWFNPADT